MAHYSYASPDRKSVLVVEMDQTHAFHQPCRLVPFDGSSAGRQVGPRGTCTSAAWSPDGKWMYFGATVGGSSHLWRQKFPDGAPEQITFGPIEEEGIALAPDGRSLVTSVGTRRSAIWIHDAAGERAISSEGYAVGSPPFPGWHTRVLSLCAGPGVIGRIGWMAIVRRIALRGPRLRKDRQRAAGRVSHGLRYFARREGSGLHDNGKRWRIADLAGVPRPAHATSPDRSEPEIRCPSALTEISSSGRWRRTTNWLVRIKKDGRGRERITTAPILEKFGVSPDGEWVIVLSPGAGEDAVPAVLAVPIHGGAPKKICVPDCSSGWSSDGRFFYVAAKVLRDSPGKTLAIPVPAGKSLPDLPASGINLSARGLELQAPEWIEHGSISPGPDPSIIRVHQDGPAAQSFSDTTALIGDLSRALVPYL